MGPISELDNLYIFVNKLFKYMLKMIIFFVFFYVLNYLVIGIYVTLV